MAKWTDLHKAGVRGPNYLKLLNKTLGHVAKHNIDTLREEMNANFRGTLEQTTEVAVNSTRLAEKINTAIRDGSITQDDTFNGFRTQLKVLGIEYGKFDAEMDHQNISVIAQQLQLTFDALQYQKTAYAQKTKTGVDYPVPSGTGVTRKSIDSVMDKMKELILLEEGLATQWKGESNLQLSDVSRIIGIMDKNKTGIFKIDKVKNVKGADGPVMTLQIIDKWRHKTKSEIQRRIGARRTHLLLGEDKIEKDKLQWSRELGAELSKAGIMKIMGGKKNIWTAYRDGFKQLVKTGKFKPYKSKSGGTWSGIRAPDLLKSKTKLRKIAIEAAIAKAAFKEASAKSYPKKETKHGNIAKELIAIRNKVNRKLPKEIQRNMGRPALMNRTGRFANSAVLTQLKQTVSGKTIKADYTYMLNPYQTFENTGMRKWPMGYNPKPLISRSIRNLAEAETREKFGIGITTRRI